MTILLKDIWRIERPDEYKVHFARRGNDGIEPLEVFIRDRREWQGWQADRPKRNDFNRAYIFSLMRFYHEVDTWLFGGVFEVLERHADRYEVKLLGIGSDFIGRLKLHSAYRDRGTRVNFENHYPEFQVQEILREPYSGRAFPGYEDIDLSFEELETLVKNDRPDWRAALENTKGVYLISDTDKGKRYVGSAYGDQGIWSRWRAYTETGHGGNVELRAARQRADACVCRANFRFALLEHRAGRTPDEVILAREAF